jgi:uncharacterized protein YrrD
MGTAICIGDLKGRQVISISEGARLGLVEDLLFDPEARTVTHLLGANQALAYAKIRKIGVDAVMVESRSDLEPAPAAPLSRFGDVSKLPALSTEGVNLGSIADLTFDLESGHILNVEVRSGGVLGLGQQKVIFAVEKVRSFGGEAVTIDTTQP